MKKPLSSSHDTQPNPEGPNRTSNKPERQFSSIRNMKRPGHLTNSLNRKGYRLKQAAEQPPPTFLFLVSTTNNVKDHGHNEGPARKRRFRFLTLFQFRPKSEEPCFERVGLTLGRTVWLAGGAVSVDDRLIGPPAFRSQRVFLKNFQPPKIRRKWPENPVSLGWQLSRPGHHDESVSVFLRLEIRKSGG